MTNILARLNDIFGQNRIRQNEPLQLHALRQIDLPESRQGGIAEYYAEVDRTEDLIRLVQTAYHLKLPFFVLGSGSLVEIPTSDVSGLVIKNNCRKFDKMGMRGKIKENAIGLEQVLVNAESGTLMNQLVRFTIEEGIEGLEYQLGMPGTVGGAIYTDAGYKEKKVKDCLQSLRVITAMGEVMTITHEFPMLSSRNKNWEKARYVILSAAFLMVPEDKKILWERGREAGEYRNSYK